MEVKDSPAAAETDRIKVQSGRPAGVRRASRKKNSKKEKTPLGVASGAG